MVLEKMTIASTATQVQQTHPVTLDFANASPKTDFADNVSTPRLEKSNKEIDEARSQNKKSEQKILPMLQDHRNELQEEAHNVKYIHSSTTNTDTNSNLRSLPARCQSFKTSHIQPQTLTPLHTGTLKSETIISKRTTLVKEATSLVVNHDGARLPPTNTHDHSPIYKYANDTFTKILLQ